VGHLRYSQLSRRYEHGQVVALEPIAWVSVWFISLAAISQKKYVHIYTGTMLRNHRKEVTLLVVAWICVWEISDINLYHVIILIDNLNGFPHLPGNVVLAFSDVPSLFHSKSILKIIGIPRTVD